VLSWSYQSYCADCRYVLLANQLVVDKLGVGDYVIPQKYEISNTKSYRNDIERMENMAYDEKSATYAYTCTCTMARSSFPHDEVFENSMRTAGGDKGVRTQERQQKLPDEIRNA